MGLLEAHKALAGKNAAVVGGAGEIVGRAITLGLAKAGVNIAAFDNDEPATRKIISEVGAIGPNKIVSVLGDVCDPPSLDRFYDKVAAEFPHLDIVVNVAGGVQRTSFLKTTREQHARDIRLNYGYIIDSVQRAAPLIQKSGRGGSIINFTTIEAHRGAGTFAVYAGAKAATTNFTRAVAVELGGDNIRVNCIAPDTNLARASNSALAKEDFDRLAPLGEDCFAESYKMYIPLKKAPLVDDIVNGVLFLSSELARSITGQTLHIDGGTSASWGFLDWPYGDGPMPAPLGGSLAKLFPK